MPSTHIDAARLTPTPVPSTTPAVSVSKTTEVAASASANVDDLSAAPNPPRFPWLSNLGARLEEQSKKRPTFSSAPVIGDNVDLKA